MLSILKKAYPNFYKNITKEEVEDTVLLYEEMFKDCNYKLVSLAIKELINTYEYPPTIATIKKKMYELTHLEEESNSELWDKLLKAIRNGYYGAEEEYKKLPDIVKEYIGGPEQLRSIAEMDSETIHSVVKGQFLKQIENLKEREKTKQNLSPEVKKMLFGEDKKLLENV